MFDNSNIVRWATYTQVQRPEQTNVTSSYNIPDIFYPEDIIDYESTSYSNPDIKAELIIEPASPEQPTERREFKRETQKTSKYDHTISFQQLCKNIGVDIRVTSEYRPGAKTASGRPSNHSTKDEYGHTNAIDIVPADGDFDGLKNKLLASEEARNWFQKRGFGILNEINPTTKAKCGSSGNHFHIGKDSWARRIWAKWLENPSIKASQYIG